jgi:gamma-D-glutamyl-L-lysine dipeptidyl-peptidase
VQMIFGLHGIALPRDAKDQFLSGAEVKFAAAQAGDLAFFAKPGAGITHVGMCAGDGRVLHASGRVRLDALTEAGIAANQSIETPYSLAGLRRVLPIGV